MLACLRMLLAGPLRIREGALSPERTPERPPAKTTLTRL